MDARTRAYLDRCRRTPANRPARPAVDDIERGVARGLLRFALWVVLAIAVLVLVFVALLRVAQAWYCGAI